MKKILITLFLIAMALGTMAQEKRSVAVTPTLGEKTDVEVRRMIRDALEEGVFNSSEYKPVARGAGYNQALKEFEFQNKSGAVDDNQLVEFGKASGAELVCFASISKMTEQLYRISYRMIDVKTSEIKGYGSETIRTGLEGCLDAANKIANSLFSDGTNNGGSNRYVSQGSRQTGNQSGGKVNGASYNPDGIELIYCAGTGSGIMATQGFYIGKYEVTQAQWQAIMGSNPSYFKGNNLPVENVSWNDVKSFISKLNAKTGRNYRLPTEAEWVYAANGGSNNDTYEYSGSNVIDNVAWYTSNSGSTTHNVGTKQANSAGIYDMSGNVWEWCEDCYDSSCSSRVLRGGSWDYNAANCRVAYRYRNSPGNRNYNLGFRLVLP